MANVIEGLPLGTKLRSQGRTITEGDFSLLTNLTWTTYPLHSDREYMKASQFGEMVLAGPCVLAVANGLLVTTDYHRVLFERGYRPVAMLGIDGVRFQSPVVPGDTLTLEMEFAEARPTKNPNRAVLTLRQLVYKQTGEVTLEYIQNSLLERIE